jgi:protein-tyrosine phosphatase
VLSWLTDRLALGGCFPVERARRLGLDAVIDLRAERCDDRAGLARLGVAFLHLPTPDHHAIPPALLDKGIAFARAQLRRGRLLLHCEYGIGRSAQLALCVLVDQGHAPLAALRLAKSRRASLSPSEAQYEGWASWLRARGHKPPDFAAFAAIAYQPPTG